MNNYPISKGQVIFVDKKEYESNRVYISYDICKSDIDVTEVLCLVNYNGVLYTYDSYKKQKELDENKST